MTPLTQVNADRPDRCSEKDSTIRQARRDDLQAIVSIHLAAFSDSFLTCLGSGFLCRYYGLVLNYRGGILLVREGCAGLEGFACGFADPERFYGLMSQRKWQFMLPILSAVIRRPSLVTRIAQRVRRVQKHETRGGAGSCELSSVAVRPDAGGRGAGKALVQAFLIEACSLGAQQVYLDADADNRPANMLYHRVGFQLRRRFERYKGRSMNEYAFDLAPAGERRRVI